MFKAKLARVSVFVAGLLLGSACSNKGSTKASVTKADASVTYADPLTKERRFLDFPSWFRADAGPDAPPVAVDAAPAAMMPATMVGMDMGAMMAPPGAPSSLPWLSVDVGNLGAGTGKLVLETPSNDSQKIRFTAGGTGIGGKADAFHFFHISVKGDAEILGNMKSLTKVDTNSKVGIMIRESLDPDAPSVFLGAITDGSTGGKAVARASKGSDSVVQPADNDMVPLDDRLKTGQWIRLVREGSIIRLFAGSRTVWTEIGTVKLTLANPNADLLFGVAVASNNQAMTTTAELNNVYINNLASNPATRALYQQDLGTLGSVALWSGDKLRLTAWGQPWDTVMGTYREFFGFVFRVSPEDETVTLRVDGFPMANPGARAGLMFRISDGSPPTISFSYSRSGASATIMASPESGLELRARNIPVITNSMIENKILAMQPGIKPPVWVRLQKILATTTVMKPNGFLTTEGRTTITASYAMPGMGGMPGMWTVLGEPIVFPSGSELVGNLGAAAYSNDSNAFATADVSNFAFTAGGN